MFSVKLGGVKLPQRCGDVAWEVLFNHHQWPRVYDPHPFEFSSFCGIVLFPNKKFCVLRLMAKILHHLYTFPEFFQQYHQYLSFGKKKPRIHVWHIYLHGWFISILNVGKYTISTWIRNGNETRWHHFSQEGLPVVDLEVGMSPRGRCLDGQPCRGCW